MERPEPNEEDYIKLRLSGSDENEVIVDAIVLKKEQIRLGVALEVLYEDKKSPSGYIIERISADDPNIREVYNEKTGPKIDRTIANKLSFFKIEQTLIPITTVMTGGRKRRSARRTRHNKKSKRRVNRKSKRR